VALRQWRPKPNTIHVAISILFGLAGIGYGGYLGLFEKELPLWAYGGAGVAAAILGALAGRQIHRTIE
jgi:hypothetical protein